MWKLTLLLAIITLSLISVSTAHVLQRQTTTVKANNLQKPSENVQHVHSIVHDCDGSDGDRRGRGDTNSSPADTNCALATYGRERGCNRCVSECLNTLGAPSRGPKVCASTRCYQCISKCYRTYLPANISLPDEDRR